MLRITGETRDNFLGRTHSKQSLNGGGNRNLKTSGVANAKNRAQGSESLNFVKYIIIFSVGLVAAVIMLVVTSPLFYIGDIKVSGNSIVSSSEIIKSLNMGSNPNINAFLSSRAEKNIVANPYIKTAEVTKEYPDTINIKISERIPRAYVKVNKMDMYLLIDDEGMILESAGMPKEKLPVIAGLKFSNFAEGQFLEAENKTAFRHVVMISSLYKSNNIPGNLEVEISDENDIHLYIDGVDVLFGNLDEANEKMLTVIEVMKKLPKDAKGFLDVKSDSAKATFSYLK